MVRRYSFFVIYLALLAPLAWWSGSWVSSNTSLSRVSKLNAHSERPAESSQRRELIEVLDRLVAYEHYYRSVYGHFTKLVARLGYTLPAGLSEVFDVRVTEATREHLVISAFSEVDGRTQDLVSIDQDYAVHASFPLVTPRPEYLKSLAFRQLRVLRDSPVGQSIKEQGVFRDYFRYEQRRDSQDRKLAFAVGIRQPVVGLQLELGAGDQEAASPGTGQKPVSNVMSTLEEVYLAQRIFHGEVGRYAKNWSELSKVATFRFEDKAKFGQDSQVPFGDAGSVLEIDVASGPGKELDYVGQESMRAPSSEMQPIEIEAINPMSED